MSDFLMVVPEGWGIVQDINAIFQLADTTSIQNIITSQAWWEIEQLLEPSGQLDSTKSIWGAKLFALVYVYLISF